MIGIVTLSSFTVAAGTGLSSCLACIFLLPLWKVSVCCGDGRCGVRGTGEIVPRSSIHHHLTGGRSSPGVAGTHTLESCSIMATLFIDLARSCGSLAFFLVKLLRRVSFQSAAGSGWKDFGRMRRRSSWGLTSLQERIIRSGWEAEVSRSAAYGMVPGRGQMIVRSGGSTYVPISHDTPFFDTSKVL